MIQPGTRIGPYTVEAEIGTGATAVVYRVRHEGLATLRALKVLSLSHPQVRSRMLREGRLQARLKHPNIVRVLDTLDVDGNLGLLMEFVDGDNLDRWLREQRSPTVESLDLLASQIVGAVAYAHAEGLIHRDLKPANVLVSSTDEGPMAHVTDFGLAKVLDAGTPSAHDTRTGMALGTPRYMSPEQMRSAKHVDARADVFSLGCVLYDLYCGRPAFPQEDMLDVFNAVADGVFDDPAEVATVPGPALRAIRAALQMAPQDRPADAQELLALLGSSPISDTDTTTLRLGSTPAELLADLEPAPEQTDLAPPVQAERALATVPLEHSTLPLEDPTSLDPGQEDEAVLSWVAVSLAALGAALASAIIVSLVLFIGLGVMVWLGPPAPTREPVRNAPSTGPVPAPAPAPRHPTPGATPRAPTPDPVPVTPAPADDGKKDKKDKDKGKGKGKSPDKGKGAR